MQEFSSVTASSYDADALAPQLAEKSADGWNVISIVSAGTNIVAYLSRDVSTEEDTGEIDTPAYVDAALAQEAAGDETDAASPVAESPVDESPVEVATDDVAEVEMAEEAIEVPSDPTPMSATAIITASTPVEDEPVGWAAVPEETAAPVEEASVEALATQVAEPEPVVAEPAPAESTVPAGWYADPSGRYELRYWDGNAWTEHVSRAGQQFTDPPVA